MKLYTLIQRVTSLMVLLAFGINSYGMLQPKAGAKRPLEEDLQKLEMTETKQTKEENIVSTKSSVAPSAIESLPPDVRKLIIQALAYADDQGRAEQLQALLEETPVKVQDLGKNREAGLYAAAETIRNILMNNKSFKSILNDQRFAQHLINNLAVTYKLPLVDAAIALGTDAAARWIAHRYDEKEDIKRTAWERIWTAAFTEEMSVLRFLLTYASDKSKAYLIKTPFNEVPLIEDAVRENKPKLVKYLLDQKVINIEPHDNKPNSYLYMAAQKGYQEIFDELIKAGALINQRSTDNKTALHAAAEYNHLPIIKRLIALKADLNLKDSKGNTALATAFSKGYQEVMQELIAGGADVNSSNSKGHTILMLSAFNNNENLVKMLMAATANLNIQDNSGNTALMHAITAKHGAIVNGLINAGADLNIQNKNRDTALLVATRDNSEDIAKVLINAKADLNIQNATGATALMLAVNNNNETLAKELIKAGTDLNIQNLQADNALMLAFKNANEAIAKALITAGATITSLTKLPNSKQVGQIKIIKMLVDASALKKEVLDDMLILAVINGQLEAVKLLLEYGAHVNDVKIEGHSALWHARNRDSDHKEEIIKLLIDSGAKE